MCYILFHIRRLARSGPTQACVNALSGQELERLQNTLKKVAIQEALVPLQNGKENEKQEDEDEEEEEKEEDEEEKRKKGQSKGWKLTPTAEAGSHAQQTLEKEGGAGKQKARDWKRWRFERENGLWKAGALQKASCKSQVQLPKATCTQKASKQYKNPWGRGKQWNLCKKGPARSKDKPYRVMETRKYLCAGHQGGRPEAQTYSRSHQNNVKKIQLGFGQDHWLLEKGEP